MITIFYNLFREVVFRFLVFILIKPFIERGLWDAVFFDNLRFCVLAGINLFQYKIYDFFGIDIFTKRRKMRLQRSFFY